MGGLDVQPCRGDCRDALADFRDHALAQGSIIMTLGKDNTESDVDYVIEIMTKVVEKLRSYSPMWDEFQQGKIDSTVAPRGIGKSFTEHAAAVSGHREERSTTR